MFLNETEHVVRMKLPGGNEIARWRAWLSNYRVIQSQRVEDGGNWNTTVLSWKYKQSLCLLRSKHTPLTHDPHVIGIIYVYAPEFKISLQNCFNISQEEKIVGLTKT